MSDRLPGTSARLARHVAGFDYSRVPPEAVHAAKRSLLDALGVSLAATTLAAEASPFLKLARAQDGGGTASVLGHAIRVPPTTAVLANGALAHGLDFEDAHPRGLVHPNASTVPVILALSEATTAVTGRDMLLGLALGADLTSRLGMGIGRRMDERGWYPPPILNAFGAVAAAGRIRRLSDRQLLDAFSLVLVQNSASGAIKAGTGSVMRSIREAFPAQSAFTAVTLAESGLRGFDEPFEGTNGLFDLFAGCGDTPPELFDELGERFEGAQVSFKRWPCCGLNQQYVDAAVDLFAEPGFDASKIERIVAVGSPMHRMVIEPIAARKRPGSIIDAKFSLPFSIALALRRGPISLASYPSQILDTPEILGLADRVECVVDDDRTGAEHVSSGILEVHFENGLVRRITTVTPVGHPDTPMSDEDLVGKFVANAAFSAAPRSDDHWYRTAETVFGLDEVDNIASTLLPLVRG